MGGVDALTGTYRLPCPIAGENRRVRLSSFREIERLPGPAHPAVLSTRNRPTNATGANGPSAARSSEAIG